MSSVQKERKKIAVFDIDGTIFRSSLLIEFNKGLMKNGVIPQSAVDDLREEYHAWVERRGSYDAYIKKVVAVHVKEITGKHQRAVHSAVDRAFAYHRNRVYRYTRDLITRLKETHLLLAISGSPIEIVEPFGKFFGFDYLWGSVFEIDAAGFYTGKIIDKRSVNDKHLILKDFIATHGLQLKDSWGVGDTETDIDFLSLVEHPIAFNPTEALYRIAKEKKWKIVVERKNMVYHI